MPTVYNTLLFRICRLLRINLKSYHHKSKNRNSVVMDDNETHFSDHFAIYKNIESLCSTPETVIRQIDLKKRER